MPALIGLCRIEILRNGERERVIGALIGLCRIEIVYPLAEVEYDKEL